MNLFSFFKKKSISPEERAIEFSKKLYRVGTKCKFKIVILARTGN